MIQVNISSRHSKVLNRQPIQFSDAKNKHERLAKGDNYSFDVEEDLCGAINQLTEMYEITWEKKSLLDKNKKDFS